MAGVRRIKKACLVIVLGGLAACNRSPFGAPDHATFSGTYVATSRVGLMPRGIEFNGPRNCIVYMNGVADRFTPGGPVTIGPGSRSEGLCQPAEGGMEFSTGSQFGGQTMYFRTIDADTFSYQRGGQMVYLTRRPIEAVSAPRPASSAPAGPPPDEPLATLGLTPSNPDTGQVTVTTNPVTVGTQNRTIEVPVVRMENRTVEVPVVGRTR